MNKNRLLVAAICCSGLMAAGITGCSAALASSTVIVAGQPMESSSSSPEPAGVPAGAAGSEGGAAEGSEAAAEAVALEEVQGGKQTGMELVKIWGPVLEVDGDRICIDNQSGNSGTGEVVLAIDPVATRVLDAVNGFPVQLEDIKEGEVVYAYIGPAMTLSLPPITNAKMVVCQIPQDSAAPEYVQVEEMGLQGDGNYLLAASDGTEYRVPADCGIIPFLTRNMVRLTDVQKGSVCLLWSDEQKTVQKIVLFAE